LHVQGVSECFAIPAVRQKRIPAIITVNGVIHQESKTWTGILGKYRGIRGRHLEKYVLQQAEHLVAISPYVENAIKAFTNGNISVIYCPVDDKFHNIEKRELSHRILFVGGIEQRKGLHVLIEAVRIVKQHIPDVTLHIVGGIRNRGYFQLIYEKAKAYDLLGNVTFRGMVTDGELLTEYSEAGVFVLPSQEESLGIVLLEAMATGTPVIASNIGGMPYIVKDGLNGYLVRFGDHKKMAEYIVTLLLTEELRKTMGGIGKEMATQYRPVEIAKSHLQLYRRVLSVPTNTGK
jgi:glycosyltransferase involved in cell wall biosynthesis